MSDNTAPREVGDEVKEQPAAQQQFAAALPSKSTASPSATSTALPPAPAASSPSSFFSSSSSSSPTADLRLSNLLACPFPDDLARHILQLLHPFATTPHLELEGKLGRCILPTTQHKPSFPHLLDCLLPLDPAVSPHAFEAQVPMRVFRHINDGVMKGRFEREQEESRRERRGARLSYVHPVTVDLFYATQPHQTRVTLDAATGNRVAVVSKRKLNSLDFLSPPLPPPPSAPAVVMPPSIDFRLTLSEELPVPAPPPSAEPFRMRRKDRRSYGGEWWQVDCTVVEAWGSVRRDSASPIGWVGEGKAGVGYEVEVELVGGAVERVKEEAMKAAAGKENGLLDIARNLLDNMRTLSIVALRPLPASCMPLQRAATAAPAAQAAGAGDSRKRNREEMEENKENNR